MLKFCKRKKGDTTIKTEFFLKVVYPNHGPLALEHAMENIRDRVNLFCRENPSSHNIQWFQTQHKNGNIVVWATLSYQ